MFTTILIGVAVTLFAGLVAKGIGNRLGSARTGDFHISWSEFIVGAIALSFVIVPATTAAGYAMSRNSAMTYNEWWGGVEKTADVKKVTCRYDGWGCRTYDCDSYVVAVTKTRTTYDSKGNSRTETYTDYETRWHSCPYAKHEYHYTITDTLGDRHDIGGRRVDEDRKAARYRKNKAIPDSMKSGIPTFWAEAKARIDAKNPGGVTKRVKYKNYIQAAQDDIYAKFSDRIKEFKKHMPTPAKDSISPYLAEKFYPVSIPGIDKSFKDGTFNTNILRLSGRLGQKLQGDLHVVAVNTKNVTDGNADAYTQALQAYWQSPALGKNTLSKNGVVAVLGVDTTTNTVAWSRGFTGMPEGNEHLTQTLRSLAGQPFTPALFEHAQAGQPATVADLVMGGYKRVEMEKYEYLAAEIQPSGGAKATILILGLIMSGGLWFGLLAFNHRDYFGSSSYRY
ncbi:hypothetical protein [Aeromicrobium sp. 179-A 4D2 NHS]|uniref:hypothetical protein n=1 Tax=Aeromicrobium sp. 179-A 4D2 NHS TaxID=3142375 RepID=UPI00399FAE44